MADTRTCGKSIFNTVNSICHSEKFEKSNYDSVLATLIIKNKNYSRFDDAKEKEVRDLVKRERTNSLMKDYYLVMQHSWDPDLFCQLRIIMNQTNPIKGVYLSQDTSTRISQE